MHRKIEGQQGMVMKIRRTFGGKVQLTMHPNQLLAYFYGFDAEQVPFEMALDAVAVDHRIATFLEQKGIPLAQQPNRTTKRPTRPQRPAKTSRGYSSGGYVSEPVFIEDTSSSSSYDSGYSSSDSFSSYSSDSSGGGYSGE